MAKKKTNLQPWLDYFEMLQRYEREGLLLMQHAKHEAYVTQPALHALTPGTDPHEQLRDGTFFDTARRLRTYAAFLSTEGKAYPERPFAIHVVKDEPPHDPLYTLVITHRKSWRTLWQWRDDIEVIEYQTTNETN